ncbi:uncharacterized protein LOC131015445 [Salvia miltiorrhiza]|uniref:uncharacterized protein LOC131015445 n=1 Tax=Salvia miltiorrhiza TaxID=226208 RepID=UPI0025AD2477|nr:uncharacterized protein LOC131015445 [Salvia miltiorrhiza]
MGRKKSVVSYLCGVLFRKKPPAVEDGDDDDEHDIEKSISSTTSSGAGAGRGDGTLSPGAAAAGKSCSPDGNRRRQSLPMPPGTAAGSHHMRTASCGHNLQHRRSNSGVSKLVSSMSLRVMGGAGAAAGGGAAAPEKPRVRERSRYFKHEDSVWKKTIILGERCRVPDDDDDDLNLYDEKGNKIITYHPKSHSGLLQYSRQNTSLDPDDDDDYLRKL